MQALQHKLRGGRQAVCEALRMQTVIISPEINLDQNVNLSNPGSDADGDEPTSTAPSNHRTLMGNTATV